MIGKGMSQVLGRPTRRLSSPDNMDSPPLFCEAHAQHMILSRRGEAELRALGDQTLLSKPIFPVPGLR